MDLKLLRQTEDIGEYHLHGAHFRRPLTKSAYFPKRDVCDTLCSLPSVNTVYFIENSWICTGVQEIMVCAGFVLMVTGVEDGQARAFPLKVQNGYGKKASL